MKRFCKDQKRQIAALLLVLTGLLLLLFCVPLWVFFCALGLKLFR